MSRNTVHLGWPRYEAATFSPAVLSENLIHLSGIGSTDEAGTVLFPDDLVAQVRQIYRNVAAILAAAGATLDDIVHTRDYIVNEAVPDYRRTAEIRRELFAPSFPAATGIVVAGLLRRGMLIEIDVVAQRPRV